LPSFLRFELKVIIRGIEFKGNFSILRLLAATWRVNIISMGVISYFSMLSSNYDV